MPCFKPISGIQIPDGRVIFQSTSKGWNGSKYKPTDSGRQVQVGCGRCIGCRIDHAKQWSTRIMHEASMHERNCFITLTYNPEHIPPDGSLKKKHFQDFMKRLRKHIYPAKVRFYHVGEYGDKNNRPHYHAILFGHDFDDQVYLHDSDKGNPINYSPTLEKLWGMGFVQVGEVSYESANYCARYVTKKIGGKEADRINPETDLRHYERIHRDTGEIVPVIPEYATMSRRPGIGSDWIDQYSTDVYPKDYTNIDGVGRKPPRYYDKRLKLKNPDLHDEIKATRTLRGYESADNSPDRLSQREQVLLAKTSKQTRNL